MTCKTCGASYTGDGYSSVMHCENLDVIGMGYAPDAGPIDCEADDSSDWVAMNQHLQMLDSTTTSSEVVDESDAYDHYMNDTQPE